MSTPKMPDPEKIRKAKEKAEKKALEAVKIAEKDMPEIGKDELFRYASRDCAATIKVSGKTLLACSLTDSGSDFVKADPFNCSNDTIGVGCILSDNASMALRTDKICIDGVFISKVEGGSSLSPYVPSWPTSGVGIGSGVMIGTGVDLGSMDENDLRRLKGAGVSQATLDAMKPLLGKRAAEACQALREAKINGPIVFPQTDVELIDVDAMKKRVPILKQAVDKTNLVKNDEAKKEIKREQKKTMPDIAKMVALNIESKKTTWLGDLTCMQQTILFSAICQEGNIDSSTSQSIARAMLAGDDVAAKIALVSKTKSTNNVIRERGELELSYFENGK